MGSSSSNLKLNIGIKVKSAYILRDIFSIINIKRKLKIVNYNKFVQRKLEINLKDYKKMSEQYKLNGYKNRIINGKGKEYNDNFEVIFKGEYKDGKRFKGKGKEYNYKDELIFEGE